MKIATWFFPAALGTSLLAGPSGAPEACGQARTDPYSLSFVKSAFESFSSKECLEGGFINLTTIRQGSRS